MNCHQWVTRVLSIGMLAAVSAASAKTLALWPMEWDPETGLFDGRNAVQPDYELWYTSGDQDPQAQGPGWNLPPNPEESWCTMFEPVNRTAVFGSRAANVGGQTMVAAHPIGCSLYSTNTFTVEGWIKLAPNPSQSADFGLGKTWTIILQSGEGSTAKCGGWILSWRGDEGARKFWLTVAADQAGRENYDSNIGPQLSAAFEQSLKEKWHHLALTHKVEGETSTWRLYVDGSNLIDGQEATVVKKIGTSYDTTRTAQLYFGGRNGNSQHINASFDYWRVSDEALEPAAFLCAGGAGSLVAAPVETSTVAYWKLGKKEDGSLDTWDYVGRANLHGGMMPTAANQAITNAWRVAVPDADCAFAGNPPNPAAGLGEMGNAGSLLMRYHPTARTPLTVPDLGRELEPATGSFTVEGWFKPQRREHGTDQLLFGTRNGNNGWALTLLPWAGKYRFSLIANDQSADKFNPSMNPLFSEEKDFSAWDDWRHLALVYDALAGANGAGQWRCYVDGDLVGAIDANAWVGTTLSEMFFIGGRPNAANNFTGWIDCLRVSKAALQVDQFLCAANGRAAENVLAYWPLNCVSYSFDGRDATGNYFLQSPHRAEQVPVAADDAPTVSNVDRSAGFDGFAGALEGSALFRAGSVRTHASLETNDPLVYDLINGLSDYTFECYFKRSAGVAEGTRDFVFLTPRTVTQYGRWLQPNQIFSFIEGEGFNIEDTASSESVRKLTFAGSASVSSGVWHHLALSRQIVTDGELATSVYRLYLDGAFVSSLTLRHDYLNPTCAFRLGGRPDDTGNAWNGQLSSVRLSKAVLDPAQFLCAATSPAAPGQGGTVVYWPLENRAGTADAMPAVGAIGYRLGDCSAEGISGVAAAARARLPAHVESVADRVALPRENNGSIALAGTACLEAPYLGERWLTTQRSFTVEGWFRWTGATRGQEVTLCGTYLSDYAQENGLSGWKLFLDDTGEKPVFALYARSGFHATPLAKGSFAKRVVLPGVWHHVALAYDCEAGSRGVWRLYLDGVHAGDVANRWRDALRPAVNTHFKFGLRAGEPGVAFAGELDMWRISGGARAPEELLSLKRLGFILTIR